MFFSHRRAPCRQTPGHCPDSAGCLVVIPDDLINNAPLSVDITPVAIGFGKFGVQADRLIEVCNGPTELAFDIKGIGPIVEGRDKIWLQTDGLIEVGDGPVPMPFFLWASPRLEKAWARFRPVNRPDRIFRVQAMIWMSGWPPPKSHRRTSWLKSAWTVCAHEARNKAASAAYLIMSPLKPVHPCVPDGRIGTGLAGTAQPAQTAA